MTFVSKHGRRTSTEDLYREVLRRWRKCSATVWLLLLLLLLPHFCCCGALRSVATNHREMTHNETTRHGSHHPLLPASNGGHGGGGQNPDRTRPFPKGPLSDLDIRSSIRQVSASAKECVQRLNATSFSSSLSSDKSRTAVSNVETLVAPTINNTTIRATTAADVSSAATKNARPGCKKQALSSLTSQNFHQCLYLDELSAEDACRDPRLREQVHLRFCSQYHLGYLLPPLDQGGTTVCEPPFVDKVRRLDETAKLLVCQFEKLLELYDCDTNYSVSWTCKQCKKAYKQWVCAMVLPYYEKNGEQVKPCRSVCRLVEQMCPYFHPSVKEQYAGERVFKCIDPDIPDMERISPRSVFGLPGQCYCPHDLDPVTETPLDSDLECQRSSSTTTRWNMYVTTRATTTTLPSSTTNSGVTDTNSSSTASALLTQRLPQRSYTTPNSKSSSSSGGSCGGGSGAWCVWTLLLSLLVTITNVARRTVSNGVSSSFSSGREPT